MKKGMSWNDRFALIDFYKPSLEQITKFLEVTSDELEFATEMRQNGYFEASSDLDVNKYDGIFTGTMVEPEVTDKPITATKKFKIKVKKKRGRKGDKITSAFAAIPTTPVDVISFSKQYGISVPVLRQSKRFLSNMDQEFVKSIGTINVRKDKVTKKLVIWRS